MRFVLKFLISVLISSCSILIVAACSLKSNSNEGFGDSSPKNRSLTINSEPLIGTIDGYAWKMGTVIAQPQADGDYTITIAGEGVPLSCINFFPLSPHLIFSVPGQVGEYSYDGSGGGRLVNVIFPYTTENGGGSDNILASNSVIVIDDIKPNQITGRLAALSPEGLSHNYNFSGGFTALICEQ